MKFRMTLALIVFSFSMQLSAQVILEGRLLTDAKVPVSNTRIGVVGGTADVTDSKGQFRINLPLDFIEGERVILNVSKENWVINHPLDGQWNLPNIKYQHIQTIDVIIVPFGSKALWSNKRIEKYIALLSDEITKLKNEVDKPRLLDFNFYLDNWATKYGFTPQEVKTAFDDWAAQVEDTNDYRTLGLKAFYEKNLLAAAFNFEKAALQGEQRLKELTELNRKETLATYENWKDAGNAYSNLYQFSEALQSYQKADSLISKHGFPVEWAEIQFLIGNSKGVLGYRVEGTDSWRYLVEAVEAYQLSLQIRTFEYLPGEWADTQNNLGMVFSELGRRTSGDESLQFLKKAFDAFSLALQIYTREKFGGYYWARTQNYLGIVYTKLGQRTSGEESSQFLKKAVEAFNFTLQVLGREIPSGGGGNDGSMGNVFPENWAGTRCNLGNIFAELVRRNDGDESLHLFEQAVDEYRLALQIYDPKFFQQDWWKTQNNLGDALKELASRTDGEESEKFLQESNEAYELAKQVLKH